MKVKVKRLTHKSFDELVWGLGKNAEFIDVPTTVDGVSFRGVFTNMLKQTIAIAWPVDRPPHAQAEFAKTYCQGGYPVEFIERNRDHSFSVIKGNK